VVVAQDLGGDIATALAGAPVTLAEPAPVEVGPVGQMLRGIEVATTEVQEISAALLWPSRFTWVGPETVTSLIEAHGVSGDRVLTPAFEGTVGWPVLLPIAAIGLLHGTPADRMPDQILDDLAAGGDGSLQLGDPGVIHDRSVSRADLPPYAGPDTPAGGHVHEWGATIADEPDEGPLAGPALAPYGQAAEADSDQPG
jgi:hypothetical protein